jgi:hypothetical protein
MGQLVQPHLRRPRLPLRPRRLHRPLRRRRRRRRRRGDSARRQSCQPHPPPRRRRRGVAVQVAFGKQILKPGISHSRFQCLKPGALCLYLHVTTLSSYGPTAFNLYRGSTMAAGAGCRGGCAVQAVSRAGHVRLRVAAVQAACESANFGKPGNSLDRLKG